MATKKAPPATKTTTAQKTAAKNKKAAAMLKLLLSKMDKDIYESLCCNGQELVLEAAKLVGVKPDAFAEPTEVRIELDPLYIQLPASYGGNPEDLEDYVVSVVITHKPTGEVFEEKNWGTYAIDTQC